MAYVVTIFVLNDNEETLMQYNTKQKAWLPPGGFSEGDEFHLSTGIRETKEEAGLSIANSLTFLGYKTFENPNLDYRTKLLPIPLFVSEQTLTNGKIVENFIYLAKASLTTIDNDEFQAKWVSFKDINDLDTFENVKMQVKFIAQNLDSFEELPYKNSIL